MGETHAPQAPASSRHEKLPPGSLDENSNRAVFAVVDTGPYVMVVCGGVVSGAAGLTVQVCVAGLGSALPPASIAVTSKVCGPAARPDSGQGEAHGADAPLSSLQRNVEPCSVAWNWNVAAEDCVSGGGPESITVFGGPLPAPNFSRTNFATDGTPLPFSTNSM